MDRNAQTTKHNDNDNSSFESTKWNEINMANPKDTKDAKMEMQRCQFFAANFHFAFHLL